MMGKLVSWIAVISLLLIVPFGSWYYLRSGLLYRKSAMAELVPKDTLEYSLDSLRIFRGQTTILVLGKDTGAISVSRKITKQFEKVPRFQIVFTALSAEPHEFTTIDSGYLADFLSRYPTPSYILLDSALQVRSTYTSSLADVQKLIEHTALVLPRQKDADIVVKNK